MEKHVLVCDAEKMDKEKDELIHKIIKQAESLPVLRPN